MLTSQESGLAVSSQPSLLPLHSWLLQWFSFVEREDTPLAPPPPDPERRWSASSLFSKAYIQASVRHVGLLTLRERQQAFDDKALHDILVHFVAFLYTRPFLVVLLLQRHIANPCSKPHQIRRREICHTLLSNPLVDGQIYARNLVGPAERDLPYLYYARINLINS